MSGGLIQLIAHGSQDFYLTGNPQITFFKTVYRRYTNFSTETIEHQFTGEPNFNKRLSSRIIKNGDLLTKMYVKICVGKVCLKNLYNTQYTDDIDTDIDTKTNKLSGYKFAWVRRLGHAILKEISVDFGGNVIDRQYGTWLDIWYELSRNPDHDVGYAHMIGDVPELTEYNSRDKDEYTMYIPLQFWFNRFCGLAVPLIALQYHEMNIHIELEKIEKLIIVNDCIDKSEICLKDVSLLIDYVYLDTDERKRFAQVGHEYLVEQLQWNGIERAIDNIKRYRLDFNHPVKELFWALKQGNYISGKAFVYYSHEKEWCIEDAAKTILKKSISIGNNPKDIVGGKWIKIDPKEISTVDNLNIRNNYNQKVYVNPNSLMIDDYGITNKICANITINKNGKIICKDIETTITIRDLSFPVEMMNDTRFNAKDPIVYQFNNYGLLIDGTVNPVRTTSLQLNGNDRFDTREGAYFNYVQPEYHHRNTPADGINVYSFSLFPEEYQPSGAANFSRIEKSDLIVGFYDPTVDYDLPELNYLNEDNEFFIYGVNYNVFRIMSGLSGLAYIRKI